MNMSETFRKGDSFGGFTIVTKISVGEFGETWLCENSITKRKAVLKGLKEEIFKASSKFAKNLNIVERTEEEARIASALDTNRFTFVPRFYDAVRISDGRVFFLTEFIDGRMFRDWLEGENITDDRRVNVAVNLLHSINLLHKVGIIHRDLAGDNILIDDNDQVKVVDFGLAKIKSELLISKYSETTKAPFTKTKYTPPKVIEARNRQELVETDETWDLYALGVLFFELFSGAQVTYPQSDISKQALVPFPVSKFRTLHMLRPLSSENDDKISNLPNLSHEHDCAN